MNIIKRDGTIVKFDRKRIENAINAAFLEVDGKLYETDTAKDIALDIEKTIKNLIETQAPNVKAAKKQAIEAIDLVKFKVEKKIKNIANALKSEKMEKAKKLEEADTDYDIN